MSNEDNNKSSSSGWFVFVIFILVSYPLSVGPYVWLSENGYVSGSLETAVEKFFFPLQFLYENSTAVELFFYWYLKLFGF